jgi:hypothetical protein
MSFEEFVYYDLDPDLLVSWNLQRARKIREWTQAEAIERLDRFGLSWSVASLSDAERAWLPDHRTREFTASDLTVFSLAYDLPLAWWFLPRPPDERGNLTFGLHQVVEPFDEAMLVRLSLGSSREIEERLASLGVSRSLAAEDKRHLLALIDAQEAQLAEWLESVKDARDVIEKHHQSNNPEGQ